MTLTYTITNEGILDGLKQYQKHRIRSAFITLPAIGSFALVLSVYFFLNGSVPNWRMCGLMAFIAIMMLFLPTYIKRSAAKEAVAGNLEEALIGLDATDSEFSIISKDSSYTSNWSAFADFKICTNGILLYSQKHIYLWVPDTATIEDGTWQEFTDLVFTKITRKI